MLALAVALAVLHAAGAWTAGRFGAAGSFRDRFVALSYQAAPAAMNSLLLGLGVDLFKLVPAAAAQPLKIAALVGAVVWGACSDHRNSSRMGLRGPTPRRRCCPASPAGFSFGRMVAGCCWRLNFFCSGNANASHFRMIGGEPCSKKPLLPLSVLLCWLSQFRAPVRRRSRSAKASKRTAWRSARSICSP